MAVAKDILQNRENRLLEKGEPSTETLLWGECGFDTDTSSLAIESFLFGNRLCSADLGTCISCIAHLNRVIDQFGLQGLDVRGPPILTSPADDRLENSIFLHGLKHDIITTVRHVGKKRSKAH